MDPNPDARPEGLTAPLPGTPDPGSALPPAGRSADAAVPGAPARDEPEPAAGAQQASVPAAPSPRPAASAAPGEAAGSTGRVSWADRGAVSPADAANLAAALAEIQAARQALDDERARLGSAARSAVDVRQKVRRNPGKTAGLVGGAAFLAAGGPRRLLRGVRRRVFGAPEPLPASLLPEQVERAVRALGDDGAKVRGALEREFAEYLATTRGKRRSAVRRALVSIALPVVRRAASDATKRAFSGPARR